MFLSIVIPIHNAEKYLQECLDSCLAQDISYDEYEIICVNDGSTDRSGEILEEYRSRYANIVVITQEQGGVSRARNVGIDAAQGEFLWFIDADDFIQKNMLGKLARIAAEPQTGKVVFRYYEYVEALTEEERSKMESRTLEPHKVHSEFSGACLYITRTSLIKDAGLKFSEEISYGEDTLFSFELGRLNPGTVRIDDLVYFYRRNKYSVTQSVTEEADRKRMISKYLVTKSMAEYAIRDTQTLNHDALYQLRGYLMPLVRSIAISAATMPAMMRRDILGTLAEHKLFPLFLYREPKEWFPQKIHMNHAHLGIMGKILDYLFFYSTTRIGFAMLLLYKRIRKMFT